MIYDLELDNIRCIEDADGSKYSLWGAGGRLNKVYYPSNNEQMLRLINSIDDYFIIGRGSNLLISDDGYNKAVISTARLKDLIIENNHVYCGAGVSMAKLAKLACESCLSGFEELSGIPCSMGGAVIGNAGAYGKEIAQLVDYVDICENNRIERKDFRQIKFAYRDSSLKNSVIIGVGLKLLAADKELIKNKLQFYSNKRKLKQPRERSLGSVFKSYEGTPAAIYIEKLNIKGYTMGGAMISPIHCNFIVNIRKATTNDYIQLAKLVQDRVNDKFGILLSTEIAYLGAVNEDFRRLSHPYEI